MDIIKIILALILLPFLSMSQTLPEGLIGDWYPERYENYKTGKVVYAPQSAYRILKISFTPATIKSATCNGIHCDYSIQDEVLSLTCSAGTFKGCNEWENMLEDIFKRYGDGATIKLEQGILDIKVENEFILTLYR